MLFVPRCVFLLLLVVIPLVPSSACFLAVMVTLLDKLLQIVVTVCAAV